MSPKKSKRSIFTWIKDIVTVILVTYIGINVALSAMELASGDSKLIYLTLVEAEHNQEYKHPLYTICPIPSWSSNLTSPNLTLKAVITMDYLNYPSIIYVHNLNSLKLNPDQYTTWVKTHTSGKTRTTILVACQTLKFDTVVVPGQAEGKIKLVLASKDPSTEIFNPTIDEYRVYIHEHPGYINSFMLANGRPHMVIPGFSPQYQMQHPQLLHYIVKQERIELPESQECDPDPSRSRDCFENHLKNVLGDCEIPWKIPDNPMPCPPCNFPETMKGKSNPCLTLIEDLIVDVRYCSAGSSNWTVNCLAGDNLEYRAQCSICDKDCKVFPEDELCTNRKSLVDILTIMPHPWEKEKLLEETGCKLPCSYARYSVRQSMANSPKLELTPGFGDFGLLNIELSTEDIETLKGEPAYHLQGFLSDIGGNVGMFLGYSLIDALTLLSKRMTFKYQIRFQRAIHLLFVTAAVLWCLNSYNKLMEKVLRQDYALAEKTESDIIMPYFTLCPTYYDNVYRPISGVEKFELTFQKFDLSARHNPLSKNFPYKGDWTNIWKFGRNFLIPAFSHGQQCYTYKPSIAEKETVEIEIIKAGMVELSGYVHSKEGIEHAFMHKTSTPKFFVPTDNPVLQNRGHQNANNFKFIIQGQVNYDYNGRDCVPEPEAETADIDEKCFLHYLESNLGCNLPWDDTKESSCSSCQFPFVYKDQNFTACTDMDSVQKWCPTAVTFDGTVKSGAWQFCPENCSPDLSTNHDTVCKTKQSLKRLLDLYQDSSKKNPKELADLLQELNYPFSCKFIDYNTELQLKYFDPMLENDTVRLVFTLVGQDQTENLHKDVNYSHDSFLSDIGNAFGLLMGLSIFKFCLELLQAIKALFLDLRRLKSKRRRKLFLANIIDLLKWIVALIIIIYLIFAAFLRGGKNIIPFSFEPSDDQGLGFFESNGYNFKMGLSKGLSGSKTCNFLDDVADGFCDDRANIEECEYDGGDCCNPVMHTKPNPHLFCKNCTCHSGSESKRRLKKGFCEVCIFPFIDWKNPNLTHHDCTHSRAFGEASKEYICPAALLEDGTPMGPPFELTCPEKQGSELVPTCFE